MSWRELRSWLRHPAPDSVLARAVAGPDADWTLTNQLLAGIYDQLAAANWQRGGGKGPRPKPLPRPGVGRGTKHYGRRPAGMSNEQAIAALRQQAGRE